MGKELNRFALRRRKLEFDTHEKPAVVSSFCHSTLEFPLWTDCSEKGYLPCVGREGEEESHDGCRFGLIFEWC